MRRGLTMLALLLMTATSVAAADRQVKPFIGATFDGSTTLFDLENAAGTPHVMIGVGTAVLWDVVGVDVDFASAPSFFQNGNRHLVLHSNVTTFTGNVVVGLPRRLTEYTLRPYFVGGTGLLHARIEDAFGALPVSSNQWAIDLGGGVTGFLSNRVGLSWEVRHFRSLGRDPLLSATDSGPQLSFWRASMAVAIRY